ncbi:MAG: hypothetical protein U9N19_01565 [Thermodesulfobacteriota bacterium]|nr:hypothetical protein [Thermodesulfobacteriota bacterium]
MHRKIMSTLFIVIMILPATALAGLAQPGDKDYPPYYMLITTNLPHILDMLKNPEVFKLNETQRQRLEEIKKETLEVILKRMKIIKALEIQVRDNLFVKEQGKSRKGLKPLLDEIEKHRRIMTELHVD